MSDVYQVTLETPAAIVEKDSRRSDEVRKRLEQLDTTLTLTAYEQADLWAEVKQNDYWREWKYESLKDYIKKSGVDLSPREVDYRIGISVISKLLGINKTSLAKAKISKLKLICTLNPHATVVDSSTGNEEKMSDIMIQLVEDAPNKTLKEIKKIVDQLNGVTQDEDDEMTWLNVRLRRDAKEIIMKAVAVIVAQSGSTFDLLTKEEKEISLGVAFERMAADTLADPNNQVEEFENDPEPDFEDSHDDSDEKESDYSESLDEYVDADEESDED